MLKDGLVILNDKTACMRLYTTMTLLCGAQIITCFEPVRSPGDTPMHSEVMLFCVCVLFCFLFLFYINLLPVKLDHVLTSEGIPSLRGSFSLIHWAKRSAVWKKEWVSR